MSFSPFKLIGRGLTLIWQGLDTGRRILLNLIFLLLIISLGFMFFSDPHRKLEDKTALILDFKGSIVEQHAGSARDSMIAEAQGDLQRSVQLRDILQALDAASKDPKINSAVLLLDELKSAGLPTLREVAAAIDRFKASGKTVTAWGSSYDQRQYFLAAHANQVLLHPMGMVVLNGFGQYRNYYRDALDKLGISVNLIKVGTYKSFAEPYIANAPSPAASEADAYLLQALWKTYTSGVENARKLGDGSIMQSINNLPELLEESGGDSAQLALKLKWVDGLKTRDELRVLMRKTAAISEKSFRQISFEDYLAQLKPAASEINSNQKVAVIVASGEISDGSAAPGSIGGLSTANLVRKAREDNTIKAIVLRVDSPGGSAFGSELIRRELELSQKAGKPVIISMGNVAASGGYWISMSSDEVIADAATVTGSIGVFALFPSAEKAIEKLGVHTAGTTTTWLGDALNPLRPLHPKVQQMLQAGVNHTYLNFTSKVAAARNTTQEKIDDVAQGRVWTGEQAKQRGLVDTIGSFNDALLSAAKHAKLGNNYQVIYLERDPSKLDRLFKLFGSGVARVMQDQFKIALVPTGIPQGSASEMLRELSWLNELNSGNQAYMTLAHCLCKVP